jgi:RNA polymerase sigma-70 factor (ECF subfamily)
MMDSTNGDRNPAAMLARARRGQAEALGDLLALYRNYLRLLAQAQVGSLELAVDPSDVVQEALMEAHRDFRDFVGTTEAELVVWLRRILVRNLADQAKYHRAHRRDCRRRRSLEAMLERSSTAVHRALQAGISTPSAHAARREQAVLLADALARLPDDYRAVIVMRHIDRLPFEHVAMRMGRTSGAVRKLWARALAKLRSVLEEQG